MAKLDVIATSLEGADESFKANELRLALSVARAQDGSPVTGLKDNNFRVATPGGGAAAQDVSVAELKWSPAGTKPSGIYLMWLIKESGGFSEGHLYPLGIQVRIFGIAVYPNPPQVIDQGQTVITLIAAGDE